MELVDAVIAAVEHDIAILKFNSLTLVEPVPRLGTDMPSLAVVVAIQNMTVVGLRSSLRQ